MKHFYDLSHVFDENTYHPFGCASFRNIQAFGSHGCRHAVVSMSLHFATHMDAPWHMLEDGKRLDEITVQELVGPAFAADLSMKYGPDRAVRREITAADLRSATPALEPGDALLVYTGWEPLFRSDPVRYYSSYCTLGLDACAMLLEKKIRLVGIDVPDVDLPDSYERAPFKPANHRALFGGGIYVIENVGGEIRSLLGKRMLLIPAPLRLGGEYASGAPIRLLAAVEA